MICSVSVVPSSLPFSRSSRRLLDCTLNHPGAGVAGATGATSSETGFARLDGDAAAQRPARARTTTA